MTTTSGGTFRFKETDAVIGAVGRLDAFDDGTSVSIAPQGDKNTYRKGNDGLGGFAEIAGDHYIATVSMLQNSDGHRLMDQWIASGITRSMTFLDKNSGTTVTSARCRARQRPTIVWESGVAAMSWDVHMANPAVKMFGF